jgi:outer membrane protein assembly factor BamB
MERVKNKVALACQLPIVVHRKRFRNVISMSEAPTHTGGARRAVRWWPAGLILAAAAFAFAWLFSTTQPSQQDFTIGVAQIVFLTIALLLLWIMLFSRMLWRMRWAVFGLAVVGLVLPGTMFKFHGVNGNLVPIFEPRWVHREFQMPAAVAPVAAPKMASHASDFPQFFGPNRDGRLAGPKLATNWTAQPPAQLWRQPVGPAWSGFAVAGAAAITQEQRGEDECVIAYDLETGKVLWSHADKKHYSNPLAGEGPRATPTIAGQRVLTHGATGLLNCLNLVDGHVLWSRDASKENGNSVPDWGEATSPLVENDLVIINAGGANKTSLVAYRVADGSPAWSSENHSGGYSSPVPATLAGTRQILIFADALIGCDATTGNQLWQFHWPGGHPHIALPVVANDSDVLIASGYGTGCARVKIERDAAGQWSATQVWRCNRMKSKFADLILSHGCIYGLDDGIMECIDASTGTLAWKDGRYGHGQTLLVGDLLLVMAESGEVILLDPQPDRLRELTRFTALNEKTWNPPALAGEYLLVRNDKEAACFRLSVRN